MARQYWKIRQGPNLGRNIGAFSSVDTTSPVYDTAEIYPWRRSIVIGAQGGLWAAYERLGDWPDLLPRSGGGANPTVSNYNVPISITGTAAISLVDTALFTGTVNSVQAAQVSAATAKEIFKASTSSVQVVQVGAAVAKEIFKGTAASVQAAQVSAAVGKEVFSGSTTTAQAGQVSAVVAKEVFRASTTSVQAAQVSTAAGKEVFKSTVASVQLAQVGVAVGKEIFKGSTASVQGAQVSSATGTVSTTGFVGQVNSVQAAQTSNALGSITAPTALPELITVAGARKLHIARMKLKVLAIKGRVRTQQERQVSKAYGFWLPEKLPVYVPGFNTGVVMSVQREQVTTAQGSMVDTDLENVLQMAMQL